MLITYAAYLDDPAFDPGAPTHVGFEAWRAARPELASILQRLLRADPLAALALGRARRGGQRAEGGLGGGGDDGHGGEEDEDGEEDGAEAAEARAAAAALLARRAGSVLGPRTILKSDHFPGCQSPHLPPGPPGAPNFRRAPGARVFGGAVPTAAGVRAALEAVGAGPGGRRRAVWHVMREEPVLYVNGEPYVLREAGRPFKNLLEYRGIGAERLDAMESRLRADALAEAGRAGGRLLVTTEAAAGGGGRRVRDRFVELARGGDAVATPRQVFEALAARGYRVEYVRVPLTDGACPRPEDFDAFAAAAARAGPGDALVYTCQLGGGRTTVGMAAGCLLRGAVASADFEEGAPGVGGLGIGGNGGSGRGVGGRLGGAGGGEDEDDVASPPGAAPCGAPRLDEDLGGASPPASEADPAERYQHELLEAEEAEEEAASAAAFSGGTPPPPDGALGAPALGGAGASAPPPDGPPPAPARGGGYGAPPPPPPRARLDSGDYVGVRRFVRMLEAGGAARAEVDAVADAVGAVVHLRAAIQRYRRPKDAARFFRPELRARHAAFSRGAAYLERYCLLVAFAAYLRERRAAGGGGGGAAGDGAGRAAQQLPGLPPGGFAAWLAARPDVAAARAAIHANPAAALAPVPAAFDARALAAPPAGGAAPPLARPGADVPEDEQRRVLLRRRGAVVGRRTILKSSAPPPDASGGGGAAPAAPAALAVPGVAEARAADGLPVFTVGAATVAGLRALLSRLGAGPETPPAKQTIAVVTDLREEMVLYVNGGAYLRRELEMPAAALHHAGVRAAQLEALEARLAGDAAAEAAAWGGRLLLHREAPAASAEAPAPDAGAADGGDAAAAAEEITQATGYQPAARVTAFWELVAGGEGGDGAVDSAAAAGARRVDAGLATPAQVFAALAAEGFRLRYRRAPMSRERTPQAEDLDALCAQVAPAEAAGDAFSVILAEPREVFVFLSRTAAGSSARFAAAFACAALEWRRARGAVGASDSDDGDATPAGLTPRRSAPPSPLAGAGGAGAPPAAKRARAAGALLRAESGADAPDAPARRLEDGEWRGVMNLCRVLPRGAGAKAAVDAAVRAAGPVGDLRADALRCRRAAADSAARPGAASAARRLGLHYLQRYFLLVAFRAYLESRAARPRRGRRAGAGTPVAPTTFAQWVAARREVAYLLSTLELE